MRTRKVTDVQEYMRLLQNPENLVGVAFFVKEEDKVVLMGDIAGCGVVAENDNLWDSLDSLECMARMTESEVSTQFGEEIVQLPHTEEKDMAIESLRTHLEGEKGILKVSSTATSILVSVESESHYDGPWEWEGFPVYAEAEL